jgi:hypothetical protein
LPINISLEIKEPFIPKEDQEADKKNDSKIEEINGSE